MIYTTKVIDEFDNQIKELLDTNLIEETVNPHSSPSFMVRNRSEITSMECYAPVWYTF